MNVGELRRVAIIGGVRIPFVRAHGAYAHHTNQDMLTAALTGLVDRFSLSGQRIDDVAAGAILTHSRDWNLARESVLGSGLAPETPAFNVQRACGTSAEAAILIANKIALGQIDSGIAGGVDTISDVPVVYPREYQQLLLQAARGRSFKEQIKPWLSLRFRHFKPQFPAVVEPRTGLNMGQSCEAMAKQWGIDREEQDALALESHRNASAAYAEGFYDDLVVAYEGVSRDNNIRDDSTMEKLAKLKPVFDRSSGTITAGNSTPLTDGASTVLLANEEWAREHDLPVQAFLRLGRAAAVDFVDKEGLLMGPAYAVPAMLKDAGLGLEDFDFYEIHEAFAAQVLCTLKAWESEQFSRENLGLDGPLGSIDRSKLNVKGGSVAIGHPFAATGTRIVGTLAKLLDQRRSGRGLISVCTAGGMGVTAILEK